MYLPGQLALALAFVLLVHGIFHLLLEVLDRLLHLLPSFGRFLPLEATPNGSSHDTIAPLQASEQKYELISCDDESSRLDSGWYWSLCVPADGRSSLRNTFATQINA